MNPSILLAADIIPNPNDENTRPVTQIKFTSDYKTVNGIFNHLIDGKILPAVYTIFGAIAVLLLIWAGIQYISSAGNPDAIKKARQSITNIVVGIIVAVCAFTLLNLIISLVQYFAGKAQI